ncbi:MAG TPA: membrane protein insertion efficiency factor YidD [Acidobacteriota bacterium]|nr:membrane protein insertion efficiency factor YidD [Acidobacteriota bacterium]
MRRVLVVTLAVLGFMWGNAGAVSRPIAGDLETILSSRAGQDASAARHESPGLTKTSELQIFGTGLIRLYQVAVSSQDVPSCRFTPSCSRFAAEAIRRGGLLKGILLGADRLSRCHRCVNQRHYPALITNGTVSDRLYDPVYRYIRPEADE